MPPVDTRSVSRPTSHAIAVSLTFTDRCTLVRSLSFAPSSTCPPLVSGHRSAFCIRVRTASSPRVELPLAPCAHVVWRGLFHLPYPRQSPPLPPAHTHTPTRRGFFRAEYELRPSGSRPPFPRCANFTAHPHIRPSTSDFRISRNAQTVRTKCLKSARYNSCCVRHRVGSPRRQNV